MLLVLTSMSDEQAHFAGKWHQAIKAAALPNGSTHGDGIKSILTPISVVSISHQVPE